MADIDKWSSDTAQLSDRRLSGLCEGLKSKQSTWWSVSVRRAAGTDAGDQKRGWAVANLRLVLGWLEAHSSAASDG